MAKNRNHRNNAEQSSTYHVGNPPDIMNIDVLATITDDEVLDRMRTLEDLYRSPYNREFSKEFEVEMAYVKREMTIRHLRRQAHENFLIENQVESLESYDILADEESNSSELN